MLSEKKSKSVQRKKQDDPYYCGLLARIPNFIKSSSKPGKPKKEPKISRKISASQQGLHAQHLQQQQQQLQQQQQHLQHQQQHQPATLMPIAQFHHHHQNLANVNAYYPYKLYSPHHRLSQSQLSLWDARSLISAHGGYS